MSRQEMTAGRIQTATGRFIAGRMHRHGRRLLAAALTCILAAAASGLNAETAWALSEGTYLVTMTPKYTDPVTGKVEDPGNNEAIGQGMTEKLCGPTGLLEVDASGGMYLTVRYYLSQFISDVSFEERSGGASGSFSTLSYAKMQSKDAVEGASNIDDKYGYTDYRMKISGTGSTFRGKAYIEPMGRSVVYFFTFSNPVAGSGDFITSGSQTAAAAADSQPAEAAGGQKGTQERQNQQPDSQNAENQGAENQSSENQAEAGIWDGEPENGAGDAIGGGNAGDPVTGIPQKPGKAQSAGNTAAGTTAGAADETDYHLQTAYDLSEVPIEEARKLTKPMLKEAVGITAMTGNGAADAGFASAGTGNDGNGSGKMDMNKIVMGVLLVIAVLLLGHFGVTNLLLNPKSKRKDRESGETDHADEEA